MSDLVFLDTNVLIYAATGRYSTPKKFSAAQGIVGDWSFAISAQVLQEFYVNVTRAKGDARAMSHADAATIVAHLSANFVVPTDAALVMAAIEGSRRHKISYWDAAIVAAAERMARSTLYSEDLNHGQIYGSVRVENPFLGL